LTHLRNDIKLELRGIHDLLDLVRVLGIEHEHNCHLESGALERVSILVAIAHNLSLRAIKQPTQLSSTVLLVVMLRESVHTVLQLKQKTFMESFIHLIHSA